MSPTGRDSPATARWCEPLEALLLALFPPRCAACDAPLATRPPFLLCDTCYEVLEPNIGARCARCDLVVEGSDECPTCQKRTPAFTRLRAPYVYGGGLADMIVAAKFRGREELSAAAGRLLAADEEARALAADAACLVPVPLGRKRRRQRGTNQSAVIARTLGRAFGLPVHHALRRVRETPPQSDLPLEARGANVHNAFAARRAVSGKVVLIDDVVTSGETVRDAARALVDGGASEVVVLAVARAV